MNNPKEKAFNNWRPGAIYLTFPNGNLLSTTWARWSYSDNSLVDQATLGMLDRGMFTGLKSDTCEILAVCPEKTLKKISKVLGKDMKEELVAGYLSMEEWLSVVAILSK